jgi:hypothetical protein
VVDEGPFQARVQVGEHIVSLDAYRWSARTYERALRRAGFDAITWVRPGVSDEGYQLFGDAYWQNYLTCPQIMILDCRAGPAR